MIKLKWRFLYWISSPRLTAFLLFYATAFVFAATLEIPDAGISAARAKFFESWLCMYGGVLPLIGGKGIGVLALINLAASSARFGRRGVEGLGFAMIHISLGLLIISGFLQASWRREGVMALREGEPNSTILELSGGEAAEGGPGELAKPVALPFSVELVKFTENKWENTNVPSHYSSLVKFRYQDVVVEKLIRMNEPASFGSWTFYQSGFRDGGSVSVLQAVRNPASLLPLVSIALIFGGVIFTYAFRVFAKK